MQIKLKDLLLWNGFILDHQKLGYIGQSKETVNCTKYTKDKKNLYSCTYKQIENMVINPGKEVLKHSEH